MKKYALLLGALILSATMLQACGSEPDHSKDATRNISRENADKGGLNALPNDNSLKADESSSPSSTEQDGSSNVASKEPDHESVLVRQSLMLLQLQPLMALRLFRLPITTAIRPSCSLMSRKSKKSRVCS